MKRIAEKCLELTSLFEAELLVRLMLWRWGHPFADDEEFANGLLEDAAGALQDGAHGVELIAGIPATELNFVAAIWYAEQCGVDSPDASPDTLEARKAWLAAVRRALPSCFCNPSDLQQ